MHHLTSNHFFLFYSDDLLVITMSAFWEWVMLSVVLCVCETERLTQSLKEKEEIQAQRERESVLQTRVDQQ